jgi:CheY-like chemotaxis protein
VNILLVDWAENLVALEAALAGLDQNLVRATGGQEALKQVLEREFALILMDVQMPGMELLGSGNLRRFGRPLCAPTSKTR